LGVSVAGAQVVYSNNFECGTAGLNVAALTILPVTDVLAGPGSTFLGGFGNDFATLTLSGLTPGVPLELAFACSSARHGTGTAPLSDQIPIVSLEMGWLY